MLFYANEYFENTDMRIVNLWSTQYGAERADHSQLYGYRIQDACDKFGVKNSLALFCYSATVSGWYSEAPRDRAGQVRYCEALASEYARLGDIRLLPLTEDERVIMTLVWTQASARLNDYAKFKKPQEPKLPDPKQESVPDVKKKEEPKVEGPKVPTEPKPADQKSPEQVEQDDKKTMWRRLIGSVAGALSFVVDKIPIPLPIKYVVKIILTAIAIFFK